MDFGLWCREAESGSAALVVEGEEMSSGEVPSLVGLVEGGNVPRCCPFGVQAESPGSLHYLLCYCLQVLITVYLNGTVVEMSLARRDR